jgi:hypothetical protein
MDNDISQEDVDNIANHMISDEIDSLNAILAEHGDLPIVRNTGSTYIPCVLHSSKKAEIKYIEIGKIGMNPARELLKCLYFK